jgi:hypothetical protein
VAKKERVRLAKSRSAENLRAGQFKYSSHVYDMSVATRLKKHESQKKILDHYRADQTRH